MRESVGRLASIWASTMQATSCAACAVKSFLTGRGTSGPWLSFPSWPLGRGRRSLVRSRTCFVRARSRAEECTPAQVPTSMSHGTEQTFAFPVEEVPVCAVKRSSSSGTRQTNRRQVLMPDLTCFKNNPTTPQLYNKGNPGPIQEQSCHHRKRQKASAGRYHVVLHGRPMLALRKGKALRS